MTSTNNSATTPKAAASRCAVEIGALPAGKHSFEFRLDDAFFAQFCHPDLFGGDIRAAVRIDKTPDAVQAEIEIAGRLTVECDRCLGHYGHPVATTEKITYTYAAEANEENQTIRKDQKSLDLSQDLYEITVTQLPFKKTHPVGPDGQSGCDPEMEALLGKYLVAGDDEE